ncbi:MAG: hypothetical protein B7X94_02405 [Hydrogenophilales bacterium 17-62-8]|nr:MAG: hypothetical protein B7X94_02405 [Hydrogenophilales bacterium 17-62-8]
MSARGLLAVNYFSLSQTDAQKALLATTLAGYQRTLEITQNRYTAGIAAKTDVLQAQTQLATAKAEDAGLVRTRAQLEHAIAVLVGDMPAVNGVAPVIEHAAAAGKFEFWPPLEWAAIVTFVAGLLTMGLGSIPQQDVFQRANASKSERIAVWGTVIGGVLYFVFAAVPIYLTYAATLVDPALTASVLAQDAQQVLPAFIKAHLPLYAQIIFYGALLSVIMSTASGTLLAPSVTISENIIKEFMPHHRMSQKKLLWITRSVVVVFTLLVVVYSLWSLQSETSIHTMVANAYKITLACAFVPLVAGLYWKRANNAGAGLSIVLGLTAWIAMEFIAPEAALQPQFVGLLASAAGMIAGSLKPRLFGGRRPLPRHT